MGVFWSKKNVCPLETFIRILFLTDLLIPADGQIKGIIFRGPGLWLVNFEFCLARKTSWYLWLYPGCVGWQWPVSQFMNNSHFAGSVWQSPTWDNSSLRRSEVRTKRSGVDQSWGTMYSAKTELIGLWSGRFYSLSGHFDVLISPRPKTKSRECIEAAQINRYNCQAQGSLPLHHWLKLLDKFTKRQEWTWPWDWGMLLVGPPENY